ncbi:alpha/beta hydrolase [Steroidobacter sp. S1-65]|uniref:Alpha/beta hydrolase n=1 Tax=Steroidobacter gossypii TaxID=2805490 RepID=A0ABS1X6L3_9GAMM|nr:alpha/beta hydrolase [Steroidobacter gossypii]MBM0108825.1 alpha/beta hydrolase [Steroidobacter gossypii]
MIRHALLATALLLTGCASHEGRPSNARIGSVGPVAVTVTRDFVYTPAHWPQPLKADLYKPAGNGPFPAVVMIHGGGWEGRSRDDMNDISQRVAERGYVVLNMSYRFAPQWHFPAQLQDVQQAIIWLREHASDLNVLKNRIGAWGYSAGAHLAALAGVTSPDDKWFVEGTRVQAVVAGGTPVDLRYYKNGPLTNGLIGASYERNPDLWREASPLALVSGDDPPMFLYHGTFDITVGDNNAHAMYQALNANGIPAELYLMRGLEHLSTFIVDRPVDNGIDFLDLYLRTAQPKLTGRSDEAGSIRR